MKKLSIALAVVAFLTGCATPRPWTKTEKAVAGLFLLGKAADLYTTERALDDPNNYEINPILDKHPTDTGLMIYFPASAFITLGISHYIPGLRTPLLSFFAGVNFTLAWHNDGL